MNGWCVFIHVHVFLSVLACFSTYQAGGCVIADEYVCICIRVDVC